MAGPIVQRDPTAESLNLTACDREPIHVPGAVMPHGLLLVADALSLEVVAGAGAIEALFGDDWLGAQLDHLLAQDVNALAEAVPIGPGGTILAAPVHGHDVALHRTGQWLLAELEPMGETAGGSVAETLGWLDAMAAGFERTTTFVALCERAAVAFRALTGFDRVMIYRFLDDESGCVVAEDRAPGLDTFLHHHFPASDIPRQARALYVRNRTRVIPDIDYVPAPLRPAGLELTDLSDVAIRSVSPIHVEYLRNMGVSASASISIVKDGLLWGLVACHHATPRLLPRATRAAAAALAGGLARQLRAKEEAEAYRERLALRGEEDSLRGLLLTSDSPVDVVQARAEDVRHAFGADGLALVRGGRATTVGIAPDEAALVALARWLGTRDDTAPLATRELGKDWAEAARVAPIAGVLGFALGDGDALLWLRAERIEEIEWAGNPHKAVPHDPQATLRPRASFESWREQVRGRARRWTLEQVDGAARLRRLLGEARAAAELRRLNRELERTGAEKDSLLAQKDLLMREVDHRVQNSLQLVSSFLAIQARDAGAGAVADQLLEARSRLSAVALVHRRLYRDDQIEVIDLSRYIGELMQDLRSSLGEEWGRHLTLDLAPVLIPTDRAVSVGLIAAELVINATKYAYPAQNGGAIDVVLEQHGHLLRLIVADRGVGKVAGGDGGFGSRMMTAVVQRIGGTVEFQANDPGTRALLTAPIEGD
ncbi:histidine kinase dimerization/phosphoacceptor domain -containing protein [Sphingomonas sp. BK069]|uniref:histidine kinase dimerization/phosphoacceptor domain -containing protein n=1 Tax=Sphingomonas sp. BK069 TaxID=2586979 RepID=UPI001607A362|nr:histidine kinase dimerization/phosphoacceptor domain -containing protein [Sphingomonas sp. BK069]MBB3345718.1 light-regulated signal transduction histidine kinase (bacteriophytochrome) [Sphingomonas sp. BK069]